MTNKILFQKKSKQLLLHGPAIKASRIKLQEIRNKFSKEDVVVFDSFADAGQVAANLMEIPMFSQERLIIWENPPEGVSLPATSRDLPAAFIVWFNHEVDAKKWPGYQELFFPEAKEVSVFLFLDYLAFKDKKAFLEADKLINSGFDIHYLLTMTFYLLRSLTVVPENAPAFVKEKLQRQRKNFSREQIIKLYEDVLEIDFKIKSGFLEKDQAEFLLINNFLGLGNRPF